MAACAACMPVAWLAGKMPDYLMYVDGTIFAMVFSSVWVQAHRGVRSALVAWLAAVLQTRGGLWWRSFTLFIWGSTVLVFLLWSGGAYGQPHPWSLMDVAHHVHGWPATVVEGAVVGQFVVFLGRFGIHAMAFSAFASNPDWSVEDGEFRWAVDATLTLNRDVCMGMVFLGVGTSIMTLLVDVVLNALLGRDPWAMLALASLSMALTGWAVCAVWEGVCEMLDVEPPRKPRPRAAQQIDRHGLIRPAPDAG